MNNFSVMPWQFKVSKLNGKMEAWEGNYLRKKLRANFEQVCRHIPDTRRSGHNLRYTTADFMKCAFGVFFFQHQSLLDFQRQMKERWSRNNMETVFGMI